MSSWQAVRWGPARGYLAGQEAGPVLQLRLPGPVVGRQFAFSLAVTAPGSRLTKLEAAVRTAGPGLPGVLAGLAGRRDLRAGNAGSHGHHPNGHGHDAHGFARRPGSLVVSAVRPVLFGLRQVQTNLVHPLTVRATPPTISAVSTRHYINLGGSEAILYRVAPPDVESGVEVGDLFYRGYPASGAGVTGDPSLMIAFFALAFDQDVSTTMHLVARDGAGNTKRVAFDHKTFAKPVIRSRITIDDRFLARVVPAILQRILHARTCRRPPRTDDSQHVPGHQRGFAPPKRRADRKAARGTVPEILWRGPFQRMGRAKDGVDVRRHRTYFYEGTEIDQQVHLGFDLAVTAPSRSRPPTTAACVSPVTSASTGTASFSTTGWACSRSTRTCRRLT